VTDYFGDSKKVIDDIMYFLVDTVPEKDWENITYTIIFPNVDYFSMKGSYTKKGETHSFSPIKDHWTFSDKIKALEKHYSSKEKGRLVKATFKVSSDGKFDTDFEYEIERGSMKS
jgi:hypothetical protein